MLRVVHKYFEVVPLFRYKDMELKDRLILIFFVTGFLLASVAFITTLILGMPFWINIPNLVVMLSCILLPFLYPKNFTEIAIRFLYFVSFIYLPITYYSNGGHNGVGILYFLMIVIYFSFFFKGKKLLVTLASLITLYIVVILIGYFYPVLVVAYDSEQSRLSDMVVSFLSISIILSTISNSVFRSYNVEKNKADSLVVELASRNQMLEKLSHTDQLTNVYNRRFFMDALEKEFSCFKESSKNFYVMMLDLDDFKVVNDSYGHLYGDEILRNVAKEIKESLREHDVVARYGGEEFSIIISHLSEENGFLIAERIRKNIEGVVYRNKNNITVSIGIVKNNETDSILGILHRADEFLYIAKENGKNKVEGEQ